MSRARQVRRFLHPTGVLLSGSVVLFAIQTGLAAGAGGGAGVAFGPNIELIGDPGLPNSIEENESSVAASPKDPLTVVAGIKKNKAAARGGSRYLRTTSGGGSPRSP